MKQRKWKYNVQFCPIDDGKTYSENDVIEVNETQIMQDWWPRWKTEMENKYGKGSDKINKKACIEDFCTIHWAWEVRDHG